MHIFRKYADGYAHTPDDSLQEYVLHLVEDFKFESVSHLDNYGLQTLRDPGYVAMSKISGMRCLLVLTTHPETKIPCAVLLERTGVMHVVTLSYAQYPKTTIVEGILSTARDGWVLLLFDVHAYDGNNVSQLSYQLRRTCGVCFQHNVIKWHESSCFRVRLQEVYPVCEYRKALKSDDFNVEGIVFVGRLKWKWNYPQKVRAILHTEHPEATDDLRHIELELLAHDGLVKKDYRMTVTAFEELTQLRGMLLVECRWSHGKWKIAKPCTDHRRAQTQADAANVIKVTERNMSLREIDEST